MTRSDSPGDEASAYASRVLPERRPFKERPLGRRLLTAILLCSTLLAFLATAVQLFSDFLHDTSLIKQRMTLIEQSYLESISVAAWNFDHLQLKTQMQGIVRLPDICSVKLTDAHKTTLEQLGTCNPRFNTIERVFPVVYERGGGQGTVLGTLTVTATYEKVYLQLQDRVLIIMATQGVKTFIVAIFILYIFHHLIGQPLSLLASAARRLNIRQLAEPIVLKRKEPKHAGDELDVLVTALNGMRQSLLEDIEELRSTKAALQVSEEHYRSLLESTNVVPWEADVQMRHFAFVGPQAERLLGFPRDRWYETGFWFDVLHPDDWERVTRGLNQLDTRPFDIECRLAKTDGQEHWVSVHAERRTTATGEAALRGFLIDINSRKQTELELDRHRAKLEDLVASRTDELAQNVAELRTTVEKLNNEMIEREIAERNLRENEERYRLLIEMSPDAIMVEQDGQIIFVNDGTLRLLGASSATQIIGKSMRQLVPEDYQSAVADRLQKLRVGEQQLRPTEEKISRMDGTLLDVEVSRALFRYRGRPAIQAVVHDITPHKHFAEQLRKQALNDALTGTANRTLLMDRLTDAIAVAERQQQQLTVVFIDLDHFKLINDSLGHEAGDQLLITVANRISGCIRKSDTLARLGGDEFVILLRQTTETEAIIKLSERIIREVSQPITLGGREVAVTCSIGYSSYPQHGTDAGTLIKRADAAMYRAKELGRNCFQCYTEDLQVQVDERLLIESQLRRALDRHEFILNYQPVVDLRSGRISSVEALVRWQHPDLGLLPPSRFIGLMEDMGLIGQLGEWVVQTACKQASAWQKTNLLHVQMSVNLSLYQFMNPNFELSVRKILSESGLAARYLQFELTESLSMKDPENTIRILNRFKTLGIGITIDDFGTGYSNLAYLNRFPVDWIKLDRSFMHSLTVGGDGKIVEAIIEMAHKLRLKIIAEGVETEEQLRLLTSYGCDAIQGFYFSRPLEAELCAQLLVAKRGLTVPLREVVR